MTSHPRALLPLPPAVEKKPPLPAVEKRLQRVKKVKDVKDVKESKGKLLSTINGGTTLLGYQNTTAPTGSYRPKKLKPPQQTCQSPEIHEKQEMTSPEAKLLNLLGADWAFVGNRKLKIGNVFPDFVNIKNERLLIEMYGDYWHREENPEERINLFEQLGYSCLIIWAHELEASNQVLIKIANFQGSHSLRPR